MQKGILTVAAAALPFLLIAGITAYRMRHHLRLTDNQLATAANQDYQRQAENWLTNQFEPLFGTGDIGSRTAGLPVRFRDSVQAEIDIRALHEASGRIVGSFLATSFEEYLSLRSVGESLLLNADAISGQAGVLRQFHQVREPPENPLDLHRLFWSKTTADGKRVSLWAEASWQASWIECRRTIKLEDITTTKSFADGLLSRVPNCGIVGYASSFDYGPVPEDVMSREGSLVLALVWLLVKTGEDKAYPLMIQFYWAPSVRSWLPTHLAVGYVGDRPFDPVF